MPAAPGLVRGCAASSGKHTAESVRGEHRRRRTPPRRAVFRKPGSACGSKAWTPEERTPALGAAAARPRPIGVSGPLESGSRNDAGALACGFGVAVTTPVCQGCRRGRIPDGRRRNTRRSEFHPAGREAGPRVRPSDPRVQGAGAGCGAAWWSGCADVSAAGCASPAWTWRPMRAPRRRSRLPGCRCASCSGTERKPWGTRASFPRRSRFRRPASCSAPMERKLPLPATERKTGRRGFQRCP